MLVNKMPSRWSDPVVPEAFTAENYVLCTCIFVITIKNSAKVQDDKRNVRILNGKVHIKTL